jgi:peptide/nickel transport system permease protein
LLAPDDPFAQDLTRRLIPPVWYAKGTWAHAFGTDNLGRDYLSRIIFGARISPARTGGSGDISCGRATHD